MVALTALDRRMFEVAASRFGPLPDRALDAAAALLTARELACGEALLRAGVEQATDVAFVVTGLLREFFVLPDGGERTKAFVAEGDVSGSLADLLSGEPSTAWIVAEEPTRVLCIALDDLVGLGDPAWAEFGRRMKALIIQRKAEREFQLLSLDAAARYAAFKALYGGLQDRIKAIHVASYLGITPVHLSRLRRQERARVPD